MKKYIYKSLVVSVLVSGALSVAAAPGDNVEGIVTAIGGMVKSAIPIAFGLAVVAFFFGLAKYLFKGGDEGAQDDGKRLMTWGVIAMFVMASIWGLVTFMGDALGLDKKPSIDVPGVTNLK